MGASVTIHRDGGTSQLFARRLLAWGRANRRAFPWREEREPFRILVAEVLLQRSRGTTVAGVYERLLRRWPDAAALARARVPSIAAVIRPLGLISRAETLRALARELVDRGAVPRSIEDLMSLPGVGKYAANATAAVAYGRSAPTVDGVTARVYRRYFGLPTTHRAQSDDAILWGLVAEVTPKRAAREWNWAVLDLASAVCLPKAPRCGSCPLQERCAWSQTHS